jgi:CTP synthase
MSRYIFITGGVMSGIGKGVTTAALAKIFKSCGFKVTCVKIDPYLNIDAGTMNPIEHGEVFVTEGGMECDQDIGNYERFLDENIPNENYMTTGAVYRSVIERERRLEYGGKCVQVVPHIPEEVIRRLEHVSRTANADITLVEIGGTVGEYENILFLEAARMMRLRRGNDVLFVLVSYLPVPRMIGEMKTKPTQHAVRAMNAAGIQPDIIIARSVTPIDVPRKKKLAIFCNVGESDIIAAPDIKSIYEVPINFEKEKLSARILEKFGLPKRKSALYDWSNLNRRIQKFRRTVNIGIVGKYFASGDFTLTDSYISVIEAVKHASWQNGLNPNIIWLNSESYEADGRRLAELKNLGGLIVPGGFGSRGVLGKIKAIGYARKNNIPFLGLCYGMQLAVIEFGRSILGLKKASSAEIDKDTPHPVISVMPEQEKNINQERYGGSMRLGSYPCEIKIGTAAERAYGERNIIERHRHRYEFNNDYRQRFENAGLIVSGVNPQHNLVEIIELDAHPFFVGVQFHPEFKSRPLKPHPLFNGFIKAAKKRIVKTG